MNMTTSAYSATSPSTPSKSICAYLALKEAALAKLSAYEGEKADQFRLDEKLLVFLNAL
jgi:hypothetical protein